MRKVIISLLTIFIVPAMAIDFSVNAESVKAHLESNGMEDIASVTETSKKLIREYLPGVDAIDCGHFAEDRIALSDILRSRSARAFVLTTDIEGDFPCLLYATTSSMEGLKVCVGLTREQVIALIPLK